MEEFEAAHRKPELKFCRKCKAPVWTFLTPYRIAYDIANCPGKLAARSWPHLNSSPNNSMAKTLRQSEQLWLQTEGL